MTNRHRNEPTLSPSPTIIYNLLRLASRRIHYNNKIYTCHFIVLIIKRPVKGIHSIASEQANEPSDLYRPAN